MFISLNWIKEFVNLDGIDTKDIVSRLTMSTAEVEGYSVKGADIEGVVVAKIVDTKKLENSDHLNIMKVDDGSGDILQIVTGAPNVYNGMITFLVRVGGKVAGHVIKPAKLAGTPSNGMCCSEAELGIGSDDEGIVDYKGNEPLGTDIKTFLPIDDVVIEIDNKSLSNRPDLWGHYGFAREFAAIFDRELLPVEVEDLTKFDKLPKISIKNSAKECFRYSCISVKNVCKHVSPYKMKIRLNYAGLRDINLLADMTNYLMLELGQPMHAFDNQIVKGINVLCAKKGTKMMTLEGEEHEIPTNAIVIADEKQEPVAIAGIKGGLKSGISEKTTSLLLESAVFDSAKIRKTVQTLGLSTDSSQRYEKSLDPAGTTLSIARLLFILKKICPEVEVSSCLCDSYDFKYPSIKIELDPEFIVKRGGVKIERSFMKQILSKLGFGVQENDGKFVVAVPSWRATKDVSIKEDLLEEILRMYGYDNIKPETILSKVNSVELNKTHVLEYKARRLLAEKYNASELHSYIWNYQDFNKQFGIDSKSFISLVDSSNSGQSGIRSELAPSMIKFYFENKNYFDEFVIDEIGSVATGKGENNQAIIEKHLCILYASSKKTESEIYFEVKKMIQNIASSLASTKIEYKTDGVRPAYAHPVNSVCVSTVDGEIGWFGLLHPAVKTKLDKKFNVCVAEVDFNKFCSSRTYSNFFKPVSKYQPVSLDFNFVVPASVTFAELEKMFAEFRCKFEVSYKLVDVYENKLALGDKKSMTFSFEICSHEHTLSSGEIDNFSKRLVDHMKAKGIVLR